MTNFIENTFLNIYSKVGVKPTLNKKKTSWTYLLDTTYKKEFRQVSVRTLSRSSIRFLRARQGFPVRGQRTGSNSKTARKRV